jgi:hypothetical protein
MIAKKNSALFRNWTELTRKILFKPAKTLLRKIVIEPNKEKIKIDLKLNSAPRTIGVPKIFLSNVPRDKTIKPNDKIRDAKAIKSAADI